ncbi:MAG: ACP S-malonyltransferase [Chloroflexota bacterium]
MTKTAYVFPGQGAQYVGMGRDLYQNFSSARAVFDEADKTLGFPLSGLCFEGPEEELRQTVNAQPALVTVSLASLEAVREANPGAFPEASFVAGHSLGEYTALAVSGALDFNSAICLARERGRLMHEAGQRRPGGMAAIIGMDEAELSRVCAETETCIANINCPGQLVVSGAKENVAKTVELVKASGTGRAIPLSVSAAFHSPLMQPAVAGMRQVIAKTTFAEPKVPVVANTTAQVIGSASAIKEELLNQLCCCVQWQSSVEFMLGAGVDTFIEIGPGRVLTGLIRRISKKAKTLNIGDMKSVSTAFR